MVAPMLPLIRGSTEEKRERSARGR